MNDNPIVSILVLTYNRRNLLERNLKSIFKQTFEDYEILLLDDYSSDGTEEYIKSLKDPRIKYHRNKENMGGKYGDWWAIHKAIYKLSKGKYFIYLCDDDYWLPEDLLETLVRKHHKYSNLSIAFGGQAYPYSKRPSVGYLEVENKKGYYTVEKLFPSGYMTGVEYLSLFSKNPCGKNYLEGSSLFSIKKMKECKAFESKIGTKWQAGYMFKMGPAVVGDVFFIDKPYVVTGIDQGNASYMGTQVSHFLDIVDSINDSLIGVKNSEFYKNLGDKKHIIKLYQETFNNFSIRWYKDQLRNKLGKTKDLLSKNYFLENLTLKILRLSAKKIGSPIGIKTYMMAILSVMFPTKLAKNIRGGQIKR